jgi:hypothetical protein
MLDFKFSPNFKTLSDIKYFDFKVSESNKIGYELIEKD